MCFACVRLLCSRVIFMSVLSLFLCGVRVCVCVCVRACTIVARVLVPCPCLRMYLCMGVVRVCICIYMQVYIRVREHACPRVCVSVCLPVRRVRVCARARTRDLQPYETRVSSRRVQRRSEATRRVERDTVHVFCYFLSLFSSLIFSFLSNPLFP